MDKVIKIAMLVLSVVIVISFFLPWIEVEAPAVGSFSKVLTGKRQANIDTISGFKVPIMANSSESRFMISVIEIFNPGVKDADKKSFLIWGIPGLAVFLVALFWFLFKNKWVNLSIGLLGILIFFVALFKIMTTDLDKLVLKVNISYGLWFILFGYLGMGLSCLINFVNLSRKSLK